MASEVYKTIKYEKENISIDVRLDLRNNTIWLTQSEIALVFNTTKANIKFHLSKLSTKTEGGKYDLPPDTIEVIVNNQRTKAYNLDVIEAISLRSKSTTCYEFVKWAREKLNDTNNTSLTNYSPYEAVEQTYLKYYDGEISMDVKLSLNKVWLTQEQIAKLFDKDVSVISRHIKNILATGECDKSNLQKMQIPFSDKLVNIYDMDVINY